LKVSRTNNKILPPELTFMNASTPAHLLASPAVERTRLGARLKRTIQGEVLFDAASRGRYSTDASIYQIDPVGVVVPKDEADVLAVMDLANEMKVPILARGAGTSQCGQTVGEALVIDNSKYMNKVLEFNKENATVVVQPGMVLDHLNAYLKPHGLWFPVDVSTAAQCTIGGMAGNNSCGSRSLAYGNMVHNVFGIDAVLADGTQEFFGAFGANATKPMSSTRTGSLVSRLFEIGEREKSEMTRLWPKVLRRVGGYNLDVFHPQSERPYTADNSVNLAQLLVGSEGTLAYFKRLHLKLSPLPKAKVLGVVNFTSFYKAMDSAQHIVKLGPVAVELVDRTMIELARSNPVFVSTINKALIETETPQGKQLPEAILLVEFAGENRTELLHKLKSLVDLMGDLGLPNTVVEMADEREQKELWEVRKAGLNIMMSLKGDGKPVSFIEDCAVPLIHLAEYTQGLTEVFAKYGSRGTWYAHASVGTLHVRPILDMRREGNEGGAHKMRQMAEEAAELVRKYKGAFSGEHGDGLVRSEWVSWQFGPQLVKAFEEVKDLFDPAGLMNPGKIVRASKMDDARLFRFKPGYAARPLQTALDWSAWNVQADPVTEVTTVPGTGGDPSLGFAKAVEMCNNNGHCRKFDAGTMCPSYRATEDEQSVTRGRANTLRLALSGQLGADGVASEAVHEALDLCVGCKGCKRDCPTGVDMAKMKIEALYHYNKKNGLSLKDKLVAYLPHYAGLASRFPLVANLRNRVPLLAKLMERYTGLSAQRQMPAFTGKPFTEKFDPVLPKAGQTEVILWADTFNNYFENENLSAAHQVLMAAGYAVSVATAVDKPERPLCCGRTFLAAGLVDQAKAEAKRTLAALLPALRDGAFVVGLEPSCLLTMRDEFLVLGLDDAEFLAGRAMLLEEFLAKQHSLGNLKLSLQPISAKKALLHGHCHQKAFDAVKPIEQILKLIPELEVRTIESSCCGMAGSFGYEAKHQEVSKQMAELSLLPTIRSADKDALIIADGTSCRHQIHDLLNDGSGRKAIHVAQVLAMALA
jgi:FAD/FMN-containing dehydrogenase/Fe-S oxidoreductase